MQHGMAVWANGNKIKEWFDLIIRTSSGKLFFVVHMDEVFTDLTILILKGQATHLARIAMTLQAGRSCLWVTLISIDCDSFLRSFHILLFIS